MLNEELWILASCLLRNSVLEEFSVRRLAVVQEEIRFTAFWIYAAVKESRMEGKDELTVICIELMI